MTDPLVLAIDTASEFGSIALLVPGQAPVETVIHSGDGHAHKLFGALEAVLARVGIAVTEIDCFAAAAGPGSFTGVRVAMSAVKGLAEANGKPMVAVSNLAAIAWHGAGPLRAAFVDARRGEIFGGVYDGQSRIVAPEVAMKLPAWLASLPPGAEPIATDPDMFQTILDRPVSAAPRALAGAVAAIARDCYLRGEAVDPAATDANYVRRSDAELKWKEA
ncbi:MAG: tRNA (adenosine(37)-N6)-threonylcarbamoyltransferase complex dimerization subunit type 1 TsaB [Bryobacteraceae bacterium]